MVYFRVSDLDAKSHIRTDAFKILATHEKMNKNKCLDLCLEHQHNFIPFIFMTDRMLGLEATILVRTVALHFS